MLQHLKLNVQICRHFELHKNQGDHKTPAAYILAFEGSLIELLQKCFLLIAQELQLSDVVEHKFYQFYYPTRKYRWGKNLEIARANGYFQLSGPEIPIVNTFLREVRYELSIHPAETKRFQD